MHYCQTKINNITSLITTFLYLTTILIAPAILNSFYRKINLAASIKFANHFKQKNQEISGINMINTIKIDSISYIFDNNVVIADQQDNENLKSYISDAKGSVLKFNDYSNSTDSQTYSYDAYGLSVITSENSSHARLTKTLPNQFQYNSERFDNNTRLQYLRARFYNPLSKRFITQDTYDLLNRFAYVNDNPVMNNDPQGHMFESLKDKFEMAKIKRRINNPGKPRYMNEMIRCLQTGAWKNIYPEFNGNFKEHVENDFITKVYENLMKKESQGDDSIGFHQGYTNSKGFDLRILPPASFSELTTESKLQYLTVRSIEWAIGKFLIQKITYFPGYDDERFYPLQENIEKNRYTITRKAAIDYYEKNYSKINDDAFARILISDVYNKESLRDDTITFFNSHKMISPKIKSIIESQLSAKKPGK